MIATLAWKEYREQRGLWLAIACLAALLALTIGLLAKGGLTGANNDRFIHDTVIGLLFSLMVAQGIVCGRPTLNGRRKRNPVPWHFSILFPAFAPPYGPPS